MAEKANPSSGIWVMDKWYAGLADDNFLGTEGSYVYSENVDNIRNPKGFQLAPTTTQIYNFAESNPRKYLLTRFGVELVFFDTHVYANGTLIHTFTGANRYRNAVEIGNFILVTYSTGSSSTFTPGQTTYNSSATDPNVELFLCGYILINNNSTTATSPVIDANAGYRFYGTTTSIELYAYSTDFVLVAAGALIYLWDLVQIKLAPIAPYWGPFTPVGTYAYPPQLTLRLGIQVQNITQFLDQLRIYANDVNTTVNQSYLYLVNQSSLFLSQITQIVDLQDLFIRCAINDGQQDWVVTGSDDVNSQLWLMSGTQKQNMNKERILSNRSFHYYFNDIYRGDFVMWKTFFGAFTNLLNGQGVNLSGKLYNGYPMQTSTWLDGQAFTLMSKKGNNLVVGDTDGKIYTIYMGNDISQIRYCLTANLLSRLFYGKHIGNLKDREILQIGYDLPAGATIEIQFSMNGGAFTSVRTLSGAADEARKYCLIYKNSIAKTVTTERNYIQMKILLTTATNTLTPVVYDVMLLYTEGLRDTLGA